MNKYWVPPAEGTNALEIATALPGAGDLLKGEPPRFKRKRSFWRALKRKEMWALLSYGMDNLKINLVCDIYGIPPANIIRDKFVPADVMYLIRKYNNE